MTELEAARLAIGKALVFSGAGLSAASGLPTFRGAGGMYEGSDVYALASPEGFAANPKKVWDWYKARLRKGRRASPNAAHLALAELETISERLTIVTSNVDDLHQRAGSKRVFRLHGDIFQTRCTRCQQIETISTDNIESDELPKCPCGSLLRPNVIWFGEQPSREAIDVALEELSTCDLVIEVGQSGVVSYGFSSYAVQLRKPVLRINPDEVAYEPATIHLVEGAEIALPRFVQLCKSIAAKERPAS